MDHFHYQDHVLHAEQVPLTDIADNFGTPCYVYSRATLERHWLAYDRAFADLEHQICYAVKANSNIAVLNLLARLGSGFDIVSGGELERVLAAGGDPAKTVFSGVGKSAAEIERALTIGIGCFNVESSAELARIGHIAAELRLRAPVSFRVNPDVDARTHPYISTGLKQNKFGVDANSALQLYQQAAAMPWIDLVGIDCHIGSQLTDSTPFRDALIRVLELVDRLDDLGIRLGHIDMGGGLGIRYHEETPPEPAEYAAVLARYMRGRPQRLLVEPGRSIVGNAGVLLTRVEYLKMGEAKNFAILDAAMNDLIRPSLYQSYQQVVPVQTGSSEPEQLYDLVGPICETGDFLGKDRLLAIAPGDLLAVRGSGAYGFTMSSNYNSRPRAAELLVDGEQAHLIRARESIASLYAGEYCLP